jgi:broad specificity phosphatase PhoE
MTNVKDALLILLRHGTTKLNEEDKFRGWSDDDAASLDKKGIKQAKKAARFLAGLPVEFGLVVCSDLERAIYTAAIAAAKLGIKDIHTDERLRPLNVGDYTGESKVGISIDYYLEHPEIRFPNGESVNEFRDRQEDLWTDLSVWIKAHPNKKVLEVGHLSQVVYWQDLNKALKGYLKDYATDKEDLIHPGGVVAVMPDNKVVPLLGENKKATLADKGEE